MRNTPQNNTLDFHTIGLISVLVGVMALTGCGGGGGGTTGTTTTGTSTTGTSTTGTTTGTVTGSPSSTPGVSTGPYTSSDTYYLSNGDIICNQTDYDAQCGISVLTCTSSVSSLQPGTWYFVVQAIDGQGNMSGNSNEISRSIN